MVRKRVAALVVVLALAWASAVALYAITNGQPDGDRHPYVGFLLFFAPADPTNPQSPLIPQWLCSGALIAPTVVLTAGHCTDGATYARAWFTSELDFSTLPDGGIRGDVFSHPDFSWNWSRGALGWNAVDTGVVVLDVAPVVARLAELPTAGVVDALRMKTWVDQVGYGMQEKLQVSGPPYDRWVLNGQRYYAPSQMVTSDNRSSDMWLKLTANPGQGKGGICFGDSGGPNILRGTDTILATNSYGMNSNCAGVTYSNRVDREVVLDWLAGFLQ